MLLNPWTLCGCKKSDRGLWPYPLLRPFLFMLDAEDAHELGIKLLSMGMGPNVAGKDDPILQSSQFGLDFSNPVMLAAGLDKQAQAMDGLLNLGFGAIELGTVTPRPQVGNPRPRLFRIPEAQALINRFGFNSVGVDVFTANLRAWRENNAHTTRPPVGVNLGKNKETTDDAVDYVAGFIKVAPYADFVVINISSPNTPGLRDLQGRERIAALLSQVLAARDIHAPQLPVLLKIAPDLTTEMQEDIAAAVTAQNIQGLIISNTTITRPQAVPVKLARETGGLSGKPVFDLSTKVLADMYRLTQGTIPLIGCGGISSGEDAYRKIRAGASLVQIYTSLIYDGPLVVRRIKYDLAALLRRDGFNSITEAVGADCR